MTTKTKTKSGRRYARPKAEASSEATSANTKTALPTPSPRKTKIGKVTALLQRDDGATLDEMITETGWLPHTARAAMTGLRKKGHAIERSKRGETTCYRITSSADA